MSKVYESTPHLLVIEYRQEKGDPDYGSCMWATFTFDLNRYSMTIQSDCGDYSYGWAPTPKTESFVELLCRLEPGYLLYKIPNTKKIVQVFADNIQPYLRRKVQE